MWLSLLIVALIFAITIYQANQGLFSAIIMLLLTICGAATAYGTDAWVAGAGNSRAASSCEAVSGR